MTGTFQEEAVLKERKDISSEDKWNVEALFPSWDAWELDLKNFGRPQQKPHWPEILAFKGKLGDPKQLKKMLDLVFLFDQKLAKIYTYAHLRHDEDLAQDDHKKAYMQIVSLYYNFKEEIAWIEPELLKLSDSAIEKILSDKDLAKYKLYIERIIRLKPHILKEEEEKLLALCGKPLETASRAFSSFSNADLKFPSIEDKEGNKKELTNGKYLLYLRDKDRKLRENAFKTLHRSYQSYENTLAELIQGQIQKHVFEMRARNFSSCLDAALFPHQIDISVYKSLIATVRSKLSSLHNYISLRKNLLKVETLHLYDLYVPLLEEVNKKMSFEEAVKNVIDSVAPLGTDYQEILRKGLTEDRWVDRYENLRKRSGAYSSGSYETMPYILMNFHGSYSDVMTLSHEAGHSMHTYFSAKHQPYQYYQYPIFLAEVASTFQEELLFHHLMDKASSQEEKAYLVNQKIDDIRATFFRQTMFAEFELKLHEWGENDVPLTPALLKEQYRNLNKEYFGTEAIIDEEIDIEWARIPHFYYNFYVYQYATGISAAHALAEQVRLGNPDAKEKYLSFISSGCSDYPLEILKAAGVDMRRQDAVISLIDHFDKLIGMLKKLLE